MSYQNQSDSDHLSIIVGPPGPKNIINPFITLLRSTIFHWMMLGQFMSNRRQITL